MAREQIEIEDKYDVGPDFRLPDLTTVRGVHAVTEPADLDLTATYFDTPDLRLAAARVTLRARTGGVDDGWHLKRPGPDGSRVELHQPLGASIRRVPAALVRQVQAIVRDGRLGPVVRLRTHRRVLGLLDADGGRLAEVADDAVTGETLGREVTTLTWREVEVELATGGRPLLAAAAKRLRQAGAAPASVPSKLARMVGHRVESRPPAPVDPQTAGGVVLAYVAEQVGEIYAFDPLVREDAPDAVHKMRVATRRLRSALRSYRPLFDRTVTEPIRAELRWLAGELGEARDAEVLHARLSALAGAQPAEHLLGPVASRLDRELRATHRAAHRELATALSGERYYRLLDALDGLLTDPPLADPAQEPAGAVVPQRVRKSWRRVRAAERASDPAQPESLHEVRKAAKRARYAAEAAIPVGGAAAVDFARRMRSVQSTLGDQHDAVVAADVLRGIGVRAHLAGENGFSYGRLQALEEQAATVATERFAQLWPQLSAKRHRQWLKP